MKGLAEKRKSKGFSLRRMADELGLTFQTYCNYEYGHREPNFETLKRIAQYFECTVDELL